MTLGQLSETTKTYPTPLRLYDGKGIRESAKRLQEAFSWNQGFREYFAVEATPNPFLLQILREYGYGADRSSVTELMMSEASGFHGEEIMFSSNDMPMEEFQYTRKLGTVTNLNDVTRVVCLEEAIREIPETISYRYNPDGLSKVSNDIMDNLGDAKYGMTTEQLFEAFRILKDKGAKWFGTHTFLASGTVTNKYYPILMKVLFEVAVELKEETGADIRFINLSSGVGTPYRLDQEPNDVRVIGEGVKQVYEGVLVPVELGGVTLYTKLGRFTMGPYGYLMTKTIHEEHTHKKCVRVDACAVNLMRPAMYGAHHHITVIRKEQQPCSHKHDVVSSLCENNDKFAIDRMLPEIEKGDLLVIHDTGTHGFSMGCNCDGKLRSVKLLLKGDGSIQMIRRAKTVKDYLAIFDFCDMLKEYK